MRKKIEPGVAAKPANGAERGRYRFAWWPTVVESDAGAYQVWLESYFETEVYLDGRWYWSRRELDNRIVMW